MPLNIYITLLCQVNKNIFFEEKKLFSYIYIYINNQNYLYYNTNNDKNIVSYADKRNIPVKL